MASGKSKITPVADMDPQQKAEYFKKYVQHLQDMKKAGRLKIDVADAPDPRLFPSSYGPQSNWQSFEEPRFGNPDSVTRIEKKKGSRFKLWSYKNPKKFHIIGISLGLLIFFSRPIYDAFLRKHIDPDSMPPPKDFRNHKYFS